MVCQGFGDLDSTLTDYQPDIVIVSPARRDPGSVVATIRSLSAAQVVLLLPPGYQKPDLVAAFRSGADDVVTESEDLSELVMRVEAILHHGNRAQSLRVVDVSIDLSGHVATRAGHRLDLTELEFGLLVALTRQAGTVVSKRELLADVWGFEHFDVNLVEVHVSALRRKLGMYGSPIIETVRSHGYVIRNGHRFEERIGSVHSDSSVRDPAN